jgi:hypothetical protein
MPYAIKRRTGPSHRWRFDLDALNAAGAGGLSLEGYVALRDEVLATFRDRLELIESFWQHERDVPAHLRSLPPEPDPRILVARTPEGRAAFAGPAPPDLAAFEAAQAAHSAILAGRLAWLDEQRPIAEDFANG